VKVILVRTNVVEMAALFMVYYCCSVQSALCLATLQLRGLNNNSEESWGCFCFKLSAIFVFWLKCYWSCTHTFRTKGNDGIAIPKMGNGSE